MLIGIYCTYLWYFPGTSSLWKCSLLWNYFSFPSLYLIAEFSILPILDKSSNFIFYFWPFLFYFGSLVGCSRVLLQWSQGSLTSTSIFLHSTQLHLVLALSTRMCSDVFLLFPMIVLAFATRKWTYASAMSLWVQSCACFNNRLSPGVVAPSVNSICNGLNFVLTFFCYNIPSYKSIKNRKY